MQSSLSCSTNLLLRIDWEFLLKVVSYLTMIWHVVCVEARDQIKGVCTGYTAKIRIGYPENYLPGGRFYTFFYPLSGGCDTRFCRKKGCLTVLGCRKNLWHSIGRCNQSCTFFCKLMQDIKCQFWVSSGAYYSSYVLNGNSVCLCLADEWVAIHQIPKGSSNNLYGFTNPNNVRISVGGWV